MAITAICIVALPKGETKRISQISVFIVTATWSCFAYIWLMIILLFSSKDEVEVWEGTLTLVFFFLLVITAFMADIKIFDKCSKRKTMTPVKDQEQTTPLKTVENDAMKLKSPSDSSEDKVCSHPEWRELEKKAKIEFPHISAEDLAKLIAFRHGVNCVAVNLSVAYCLRF